MSHEKKRLPKATVLSKTRYIGFARTPVRDDSEAVLIQNLNAPYADYPLRDGDRWIDMRKKPR